MANNDIMINDGSKVVGMVDQLGNNGVLHPVDHIIMPDDQFFNKENP